MNRTFRLNKFVVSLIAIFAVLALACPRAEAQERAFRISGEGVGPFGIPLPGQGSRPHSIVGEATHLGRHVGEGSVVTETADIHEDGSITGEFGSGDPFAFVGADGDILSCHYGRVESGASTPGMFVLIPLGTPGIGEWYVAFWIAEFVPVPEGCTGRFAGVSGSWVMYATSEPFQLGSTDPLYYSWEGKGSLTFKR